MKCAVLGVVHVGVAASRGVQDGGEGDGASHLGLLVLKVDERLEDMLGPYFIIYIYIYIYLYIYIYIYTHLYIYV